MSRLTNKTTYYRLYHHSTNQSSFITLWTHPIHRFQFSTIATSQSVPRTCRTSRAPSPSPAGCCGTRAAASPCDEGQAAEGLRSEGTSRPKRNKVNQTVAKCENDVLRDMWATKKPLIVMIEFHWLVNRNSQKWAVRTPIIAKDTLYNRYATQTTRFLSLHVRYSAFVGLKQSLSICILQHWGTNTGGTHQVETLNQQIHPCGRWKKGLWNILNLYTVSQPGNLKTLWTPLPTIWISKPWADVRCRTNWSCGDVTAPGPSEGATNAMAQRYKGGPPLNWKQLLTWVEKG